MTGSGQKLEQHLGSDFEFFPVSRLLENSLQSSGMGDQNQLSFAKMLIL